QHEHEHLYRAGAAGRLGHQRRGRGRLPADDRGGQLPGPVARRTGGGQGLGRAVDQPGLRRPDPGRGAALGGVAPRAGARLADLVLATARFSVRPVVQSRRMERAPAASPLALALNGSSASMGQALAGATGGAVLSTLGTPSLPLATITYAAIALLIWRLWEAKR